MIVNSLSYFGSSFSRIGGVERFRSNRGDGTTELDPRSGTAWTGHHAARAVVCYCCRRDRRPSACDSWAPGEGVARVEDDPAVSGQSRCRAALSRAATGRTRTFGSPDNASDDSSHFYFLLSPVKASGPARNPSRPTFEPPGGVSRRRLVVEWLTL